MSKMHLDFVHEEVHRAQIRVIGVGGGGGNASDGSVAFASSIARIVCSSVALNARFARFWMLSLRRNASFIEWRIVSVWPKSTARAACCSLLVAAAMATQQLTTRLPLSENAY